MYVAACGPGDDDPIVAPVVLLAGGGRWCVAALPKALAHNQQLASVL